MLQEPKRIGPEKLFGLVFTASMGVEGATQQARLCIAFRAVEVMYGTETAEKMRRQFHFVFPKIPLKDPSPQT